MANIMAPATDRIEALLSLFNSGYDLTLTHSTSAGDAKGLRQPLQLGKQHCRQVLRTWGPPRVGILTTNPGAYCAVLP